MNTALQPREVDKPFLWRWCRMSAELVLRSPFRFGLVIALLGSLDTYAVNAAREYVIPRMLPEQLGVGLLPALWTAVGALAHSADNSLGVRHTLEGLVRKRAWRGVLLAGAALLSLKLLADGIIHELPQALDARSHGAFGQPGRFVSTFAVYATLATGIFGSCLLPLLVCAPEAPLRVLYQLSRHAAEMNDKIIVVAFVAGVVIFADALSSVMPAYGMTMACFLVFLGVFNYLGYRDIFERRMANAPVASAQEPAAEPADSMQARMRCTA